ncbi:MAG: glycosyltransferase family 4 protein [Bacteroidota bacterium]
MKKVTLILPVLPHYRVDFLNALSAKMAKDGDQLSVITGTNAGKKGIKESLDVSFTLIKNNTVGVGIKGFEIQWQKKLIRSIFKTKPDKVVLLYHAGKINYNILLLLLQLRGIPYVLWGSGTGDKRDDLSFLQRKLKAMFKFLFIRNSNAYLCYSTLFQKELIAQNYPPERIFVAQNTINVEEIYSDETKDYSLRKYDYPRFLFVGVIFSKKRLDAAIKVCKRLVDQGLQFRFDIVGSGEYVAVLQQMVADLSLEEYVRFHGAQYGKDLERYFLEANVFLLSGTGGLAINEAMAYSLPVITTPGDGTAFDLIEEGENGFILDFKYSLEMLEEKMKFFANSSDEQLRKMGDKSLEIIQQKATLQNMVNQFTKSLNV